MARKGNQSKSGSNHASPNWQSTADGDVLSTPERSTMDGGNLSSHGQGRSKGSEGSSEKKGKGSKKNSRINSMSSLGKQQQMDTDYDISSLEENELPSRGTKNRRGNKKPSRRGFGKSFWIEQTQLPGLAENVLEKTRCLFCMASSIFRASMMYLVEQSKRSIDRNRPTIDAYMAIVNKGRAYLLNKIEYAYPIVRTWMLNAGRLMLLLLSVWLDCNVRGFDSLLRLGTNSLLAVLWCGMLSVFAMIGMKKMLICMVCFSYPLAFCSMTMKIFTSLVYDIFHGCCAMHPTRNYIGKSIVTSVIFHNTVFSLQIKITQRLTLVVASC
jgi:DnaJ family protein C protein 14